MTKRFLVNTMAAALVSGGVITGVTTYAQTPGAPAQTPPSAQQPAQPAQPPAQQPSQPTSGAAAAAAQQRTEMTLVGCLYSERNVPGRTPNVAERVGVGEDYILADARPAGSRAEGLATGRMFKVEKIDDEQLKALVGRRVEVVGRADAEAGDIRPDGAPARDRNIASPDDIDLPELEARSIRQVEGTCPAVPVTSPVAPR